MHFTLMESNNKILSGKILDKFINKNLYINTSKNFKFNDGK